MKFKAKPFKLGNSHAIYIPKEVYTKISLLGEVEWDVYTGELKEPIKQTSVWDDKMPEPLIKKPDYNPAEWCSKHNVLKGTCHCN